MTELSAHALAELGTIIHKPEPRNGINPGVVRKLLQEGLAEIVTLASPYPTHAPGTRIDHLTATKSGVTYWLEHQ